jgi:preprotein translocase subunit Sec63
MGLSEIDDSDTEPEEPEAPEEEQKSPEKEEKMTYEQAAQILGVAEDEEDEAVLRKAFRKQSLLHHPDKNPNDPTATARFQKIGQALEMLTRRARGEASEDEYDAVWKSNFGRPTPSTRRLLDGVAIPRHRRDVVPVDASARWRGGSRR